MSPKLQRHKVRIILITGVDLVAPLQPLYPFIDQGHPNMVNLYTSIQTGTNISSISDLQHGQKGAEIRYSERKTERGNLSFLRWGSIPVGCGMRKPWDCIAVHLRCGRNPRLSVARGEFCDGTLRRTWQFYTEVHISLREVA